MDYGYSQRRRTKGDKKAKTRYNKYKMGGRFRASNVQAGNKFNKTQN